MTEQPKTITQHPSDLLLRVYKTMDGRHPEISVTVPVFTTWKTVLRAVDSALVEVDEPVVIISKRTEAQRQILRKIALENVQIMNLSSPAKTPPGLPIRTQYDVTSLPLPKPASPETRKRLKEDAMPFMPFREPYPAILNATIAERTLPVVKAEITLNGIDADDEVTSSVLGTVDMLWDTCAHNTIITEDLLSEKFRRYIQEPQHDPYRSDNGLRVQMDAVIAFSNVPIAISAIVLVVPKSVVPNERVGILFGQQQCIDRLHYRSLPRCILEAKGENIEKEMWGDIILDEFVDSEGNIQSL
jgi:hypothetical protein